MNRTLGTAFLSAALLLPTAGLAQENDDAALEAKVDALATELNLLKESLHVPEDEARRSYFGMGPAASKVYEHDGLSLGGYGEFYFGHFLGDAEKGERGPHRGDVYRLITYLGYKFSDLVVFNAEIEFEHATTGTNPENGESGAVAVEFLYLDLLLHQALNLRSGLMLMPMGIVNEMHEPTTYRGNLRPEVERRILPSTWREAGLGIYGEPVDGVASKLYLVSGLSAQGFGSRGVRGGRQSGNHFVWEDKGVVARVDYRSEMVDVGASVYYGGADQDPTESAEVSALIYEAHAIVRYANLELRGLFAESRIDGAEDVGAVQGSTDPVAVPEVSRGWYAELSYDIWPHVSQNEKFALRPFTRFEQMNLNAEMPAGFEANDALDTREIIGGVEFQPHPDVVFKLEYARLTTADDDAEPRQEIRFGGGFIY